MLLRQEIDGKNGEKDGKNGEIDLEKEIGRI